MIATTILAPIASGLLTTTTVNEGVIRVLALLGFLGFAVGIGLQVKTSLPLFCAFNTAWASPGLAASEASQDCLRVS